MENKDTEIIVVNWNGKHHLDVCLSSLFKQTYNKYGVIVVDNGSSDGSVEFIEDSYPQVEIIACKKNYGFAEGNNIGIRAALRNPNIKYIALLNNDTEVDNNWLSELIHTINLKDDIGAVCGKMLNFFNRDIIDSTGDFFQKDSVRVVTRGMKEKDTAQYNKIEECLSARAGAVLYGREMLESIYQNNDYFDRHFFAYIEDVDLSFRARLNGWKLYYNHKAIVYHKVSATGDSIGGSFVVYHSGRNKLFTAIKTHPWRLVPHVITRRKISPNEAALKTGIKVFIYTKILIAVLFAFPRLLMQRRKIMGNKVVALDIFYKWKNKLSID